ncbi:MAG TPA: hypothetical protein VGE50_10055 [Gammaproteobacteria bacterium]
MAAEEQLNWARFMRLLGCFLLLSLGIFLALALSGGPYQLVGYGVFALTFILFVACTGSLSRADHTTRVSEMKAELGRQKSRHLAILEKIKAASDGEQLAALMQEINASRESTAIQRSLEKMVEARRQMLQLDALMARADNAASDEEQAKLLEDLTAFAEQINRSNKGR